MSMARVLYEAAYVVLPVVLMVRVLFRAMGRNVCGPDVAVVARVL